MFQLVATMGYGERTIRPRLIHRHPTSNMGDEYTPARSSQFASIAPVTANRYLGLRCLYLIAVAPLPACGS